MFWTNVFTDTVSLRERENEGLDRNEARAVIQMTMIKRNEVVGTRDWDNKAGSFRHRLWWQTRLPWDINHKRYYKDYGKLSNDGDAVSWIMMPNNHLVSKMEFLIWLRWLLRWETVNAGRRRMLKRSCSQARKSSAKLIFLCTMSYSALGRSSFIACSTLWGIRKKCRKLGKNFSILKLTDS